MPRNCKKPVRPKAAGGGLGWRTTAHQGTRAEPICILAQLGVALWVISWIVRDKIPLPSLWYTMVT